MLTLRTERLTLEPVRHDHAGGIWDATEASLTELARWMIWAVGARPEDSAYYASEAERANNSGDAHHFVILFEGKVAGGISLIRGEPRLGYLEVGYWLRTDLSGRGLMTEALTAVCAYGFDEVGLHRLELRAGVQNSASRKVAEKAGFRECGRVRESVFMDGRYVDAIVYDLLEADLPPPPSASPGAP